MMREVLHKLNPAIPHRWLLLLAGALWTTVGAFLCYRAIGWIVGFHESFGFLIIGAMVAIVASRFMFVRVAEKNVHRILQLPHKACIFAFTAWRGYIMIAVMIALGVTLRNSLVPKYYLAAAYTAMGGSLFLSSFVFYRHFWKM